MGVEVEILEKRSFLRLPWSSEISIQEQRVGGQRLPIEETESREREMRGLVLEKSERLCRWEKEKRSRRRRKDNRHRKGGWM